MLSAMDTQCISSSPLDLEDIEDLFNDGSEDVNAIRRKNRQNIVIPKVKKKLKESKLEFKPAKAARPYTETSFLPGRNTIYIRTWGCAHNSSDSEYMAGQLVAQGYSWVETFLYHNWSLENGKCVNKLTGLFCLMTKNLLIIKWLSNEICN